MTTNVWIVSIATKISGYLSSSTSAIERLINRSTTNTQIVGTPVNNNNNHDTNKSRLTGVTTSRSEKHLNETSKFSEFDRSFKFDIEADMKTKENVEPPKLTLYLL